MDVQTGQVLTIREVVFFNFWRTPVLFMGTPIPLFWNSGDVCPGFQSQGGSPHLPVHYGISVSPLVPHLLTS